MFKPQVISNEDEDICILVRIDNHSYNYICDCGEARALSVKDCQNTNAVFISHTHIDHFVNFDSILRHQIGIGRSVVVVGPKGIVEQVQNRIKSYCWNLIEKDSVAYEVREIQALGKIRSVKLRPPLWEIEEEHEYESNEVFTEKDFIVEYDILDHKTESICYLFKGRDKTKIEMPDNMKAGKWVGDLKKAYDEGLDEMLISVESQNLLAKDLYYLIKREKGKSLGIIMDHAAHEDNHKVILERFDQCDKVYIECFYKDEDATFAQKNYHSYASQSGQVMKRARVTNAIPVHFSRKYETEEIEQLINQFESAYKK